MARDKKDWSWVPKRGWEWHKGTNKCGVHTYEGKLVWWELPVGPSGHRFEVASTQTFQEFLVSGPPVSAPADVLDQLNALLQRINLDPRT